MASPFLSNPAATPIGLLILKLKKEVFKKYFTKFQQEAQPGAK